MTAKSNIVPLSVPPRDNPGTPDTQAAQHPSNPAHNASATPRYSAPPRETPKNPPGEPLRGWVAQYFRRYKGRKLGPYYVRRWKVGNKLRKEYIKPQDVERVRAECLAYREASQRKREGARKCNTFIDNYSFLGRMMNKYEKGKEPTRLEGEYILRLEREGMYITGKPRTRRKITRRYATIDGKPMIVTTVFELDGTTKVFMVPFVTNIAEYLREIAKNAWESVHGKRNDEQLTPCNQEPGGPCSLRPGPRHSKTATLFRSAELSPQNPV